LIGSINLKDPPIFSHPAWYSHQGWLSFDQRYIFVNDEVDEGHSGQPTTTRVIDVQDLTNPQQVAIFQNTMYARDHNLYTRGKLMFQANYRAGLRVLDASDPYAMQELSFFDTYPDDDDTKYNGLWSVYPYFKSGTIIGSDIEKGLFVWTFEPNRTPALRGDWVVGLLLAILLSGAAVLSRKTLRG
jgi:choice-of-anchor B domain-containing protein